MTKKLSIADYADIYTSRFGWSLVPIEPGRKYPTANEWGNNCLTDSGAARAFYESHPDWNMGLALAPSRMVSLDIDCPDSWATIMAEFGLPADALDEYPTIMGRGKRVMFVLPDGVELPYCKLTWPKQEDPKRRYTVVELRAASEDKQRQDVLPPSIHPDTGKPYAWCVQPPKQPEDWPEPPPWLMAVWQHWGDFKPQFQDACPWAEKPKPRPDTKPVAAAGVTGESAIDAYCDATPIESALETYGYKRIGRRYLSPHSSTGLPGVTIMEDGRRCYIHHASDPLCSEEEGRPVNAFDLFCYYEHGGDASKAAKAAADMLGLSRKRREPPPIDPPPAEPTPADGIAPEAPQAGQSWDEFRVLGYNGAKVYVLPRRSEQVVALSAGALTKPALLQIASLEWWEMAFAKPKGGCDWDAAMNALLRQAERAGIYNPKMERGRGAWYDNGSPVLHLGTTLIVGGEEKRISDHPSRYIYTKQVRMENTFGAKPATDEDGQKLLAIFEALNWSRAEHAAFAIGWSVLAPVCGALEWRPHLWLTAQRGAGKSWVQGTIIKPLVGEGNIVYCQGGTTEAGIRQTLKHDARPVMFDEAESEDAAAARRMQSVIELARQASSEYGAEIAKGTANGEGMTFNIRSMFLMGSINVGLRQAADESRFTVVSLKSPDRTPTEADRFARFERDVKTLLSDEFCASIRSRTYRLIPVIRKNAETLAQAVAEALGSQRAGDQVGTLLAGMFSVYSPNVMTMGDARKLVQSLNFDDTVDSEQVSDEHNCLNAILQTQVRIDLEGGGGTSRSLGELVEIAREWKVVEGVPPEYASTTLARHGVRLEGADLWVANNHKELQKALINTPWATGHRRLLLRIHGAQPGQSTAKFAGSVSRYVCIPVESVDLQ